MSKIVFITPCCSQRRPEVTTRDEMHSGGPVRLRRFAMVMSSISAISGKPAPNAARDTNIAWSPVAMPVIHRGGDNRKQRVCPRNAHVESSPRAAGPDQSVPDERVGIAWKARVRMQKKQHIAARHRSPGIHLGAAPAGRPLDCELSRRQDRPARGRRPGPLLQARSSDGA